MTVPTDSHVHSDWSWDAPDGSMVDSCRRAVDLGVPAVAFTEHLDHTVWQVATEDLAPEHLLLRLSDDGVLHPPGFDAHGYLAAIEECRARFPRLRVLSGLELGEPHRHPDAVAAVLAAGSFDRLLGSVHSLSDGVGGPYAEPPGHFRHRPAADVLRAYLREVSALVRSDTTFEILAHIDYPVRSWPGDADPFDPVDFEDDFREVLRALASTGRALEVSTVVPLHALIVQWWRDEGGRALSFGSDAHRPEDVARGFSEAAGMATSFGFGAGTSSGDLWGRR